MLVVKSFRGQEGQQGSRQTQKNIQNPQGIIAEPGDGSTDGGKNSLCLGIKKVLRMIKGISCVALIFYIIRPSFGPL